MTTERNAAPWMSISSAWRLAVSIFLVVAPVAAQDTGSGSQLTPEILNGRIASVQDDASLDDDIRAELIRLYRQAISSLEQARANMQATEEYRETAAGAPAEIESIRASMARRRETDPAENLPISPDASSEEIDRILQEELANRTAVDAKLAALDSRLGAEALRPEQARARISAARAMVEEITDQITERTIPDETPLRAEADRWSSETRLQTLQAEIVMLDQELLSHKARVELLRTYRAEAALSSTRIVLRVGALRVVANQRRRGEAGVAANQARTALEGEFAEDEAVRQLALDNLALVETTKAQVIELESLSRLERQVEPQAALLAEAFRSTRRKLQLEGSRAPIGLAIREQRRQLPDVREYARQRRDLQRSITAVSLRRVDAEDERKLILDLDSYLAVRIAAPGGDPPGPDGRAELEALAETRRSLLDRSVANDRTLERRLHALDDALNQLEDRTDAYDEFLAEHLLWVRSQPAINAKALGELPAEIRAYLSPRAWRGAGRSAIRRLGGAPTLWLVVLAAGVLTWRRKRIRTRLIDAGRDVGRIQRDRLASTFAALGYTLLLSLPVPLFLFALGQAMLSAPDATTFSIGIGAALRRTSLVLLLLSFLRTVCAPGGVAERHFGHDGAILARVHRYLGRFLGIAMPVYFMTWSVATINEATSGGTLGLLGFVGVMVALAGVGVAIGRAAVRSTRMKRLVTTLAIAVPAGMAIMALAGFTHTAEQESRRAFGSVLLVTVVWLVRGVVQRWLLMTRRRLAYDAAVAARDAERARRADEAAGDIDPATGGDDIGAPEVDLVALDTDSRKLLRAAAAVALVLGFAAIWGDIVPALGIFDDVNLWNTVLVVDGVESEVPVTLIDLLVAIVIGIGGAIAAKNLPSLINIILLKQGKVSAGGRYAVESLTRYTLVALTVLVVLGTLGASWYQMGWAAAALGVGIGFGVQEIVANFICGLILLFERPVRVGDVVTIGDASGTVTMIRIRATTLRDWDRKELIVPNKELITGRLLNWSLSDAVTRVLVRVGVAYGSDVERALALLLEAAHENDVVLEDPEPSVNFEEFGDSSLNLSLRAFVSSLAVRLSTITALHAAIDRKYREAGIVIAFPQRDIHVYPVNDDDSPNIG